MSKFSSLLMHYVAHPSQFFRHASRAASMGLKGDFSALERNIRSGTDTIHSLRIDKISNADLKKALREALDRRKSVVENHPREILKQLSGHFDDLYSLAVIGELPNQLRAVHAHILMKYSLFDGEFYKKKYLNGVDGITPLDHYVTYGVNQALWPNPVFDPAEYLMAYPDVADSGLDPVVHYGLFGYLEDRKAGTFFDGAYYLESNPDVKQAGISPLQHYLAFGRHEKRKPSADGYSSLVKAGVVEASALPLPRNRGTILVVSHDAEVGGAQQIAKVISQWILNSTQFDVKIVLMKGGPQVGAFEKIAPIFNFDGYVSAVGKEDAQARLREWAGEDVKAAFVNSVASGGFFDAWGEEIPAVSYLHELPKIIDMYGDNVKQVIEHSHRVLGGSFAVRDALVDKYGLPEEKSGVVYDFVESFDDSMLVDAGGKAAAKEKIGVDPEALMVLGCGTVHWRKSPELFIEVAKKITSSSDKKVQFVWIGGGEDFEKCEQLIKKSGLTESVSFVGQQSDINPFFQASDVFLLPSEEDPFPLVCLYAAIAGAPVICFEEAGGMPEFVRNGCGVAVPFLDTNAMASALEDYLQDDEKRVAHGKVGRELALSEFTVQTTGPQILHLLREAANIPPKLSVVVPNYNYEKYLPIRLSTIQNQTYQDFEVILLDDKSPDDSVRVLEEYAKKRPGTKVIVNEENSGSPFKQWIKGIRESRAELIWMAEADDIAETDLVETLLPLMEDRNVFLSYVKSVPVNSDGEVMGDYEPLYLNRINEGRWSKPYQCNDHLEMSEGLGIANCIPNASSVIMRKFEPDPWFEDTVSSMRLCGDWFFYIRAIRGGEIAYSNRPLNYHRRHASTVTHQLEGSLKYFDELEVVREYVADNYNQSDFALDQIETFVRGDLDRFKIDDADTREKILANAVRREREKKLPSLAVITPDLSPGGGQVFAITIANGWVERGGRASLFNVGQLPDHPAVLERISSRVSLYNCSGLDEPFPDKLRDLDSDIIHSSIWWSDRMVHSNIDAIAPDTGWIVSMHGCAETIVENPEIDPSFPDRIKDMLDKVGAWAYTAEKNLKVFDVYGKPAILERVDNGIELKPHAVLSRKELGVREDALLLCVATRAIDSKGWHQAVEMTKRLNAEGVATDLMLIGEGPAADAIRAAAPENVHLYGQVSNLQDYIAASDVGMLPSYFVGESLPLVLLEMMGNAKPVLATDVGEIPSMVGTDVGDSAGYVIPLKDGLPDVKRFVAALRELSDPDLRARFSSQAKARFDQRYTLEKMLDRFDGMYRSILGSKRAS